MANNYRIKSLIVNSLQHQRQEYGDQNAGFTMAEMIVVLFMIGILSVIAAPGWSAFIKTTLKSSQWCSCICYPRNTVTS